jgi:hypothetical protein
MGRNGKNVAVHVSFVEDTVTRIAYVWNRLLGGYDVNLRAASVAEMVAGVNQAVGAGTIARLDLAGHGYPGGWGIGVGPADWQRLAELRPLWTADNEGLTLRMCEVAQGEVGLRFLAELARTIGARVRAWTGCYEIRSTGHEYTATPDGAVRRSGDTGRHLQILYRHEGKRRAVRILTGPLEGLEWAGRMLDLW